MAEALPTEKEMEELLKKDSEEANPEETEETPEGDEETIEKEDEPDEEAETEEEEAEEELQPKSKAKVQARIDELISDSKATKELLRTEKEARLALEAKLAEQTKAKDEPEYTWEQLQNTIDDPSQTDQTKFWAKKEQQLLIAREVASDKLSSIETSNQERLEAAASMTKAIDVYPELKDKGELWQRADQIFTEKGFAKVKDGQYLAVVLADAELNRGVVKTAKSTKKQLDKLNAKNQLRGDVKKVSVNVASQKDKLFEEARKTGDFRRFLKFSSEHGG